MTKNSFKYVYFISRPLFLGVIFSLTFKLTMQDSIISYLIGTIFGAILIYFINQANLQKRKFFQVVLYILFIMLSILILETFINSFFLVNTPKIIIIIPTVILCLYFASRSMKEISKCLDVLFIISITIFIINTLLLSKYFKITNILPLFVKKPQDILKSSMIFAILTASPNILIVKENIPLKKHLISYVISCLLSTIIGLIILCCLTPNVAKIYSFPEYMILKRIKISEFIENIENVLTSIWYIDIFIFTALTFKRIKENIKNNFLYYAIIIGVIIFITFFISPSYYRVLILYHNSHYIIGIILLSIIFLNKKKS